MKKFLRILILNLLFILASNSLGAKTENFKLTKITEGLKSPWSLSFINQNEILITEKLGNIIYFNLETQELKNIRHNLKIKSYGQGGLLDILYHNKKVYLFLILNIEVIMNPVHQLPKEDLIRTK
jgi:quinoprotein glucose dehydrogenase